MSTIPSELFTLSSPDVSIPGPQLSSPDVSIPGSQLSSPDVSIPGPQLSSPDVSIPGPQLSSPDVSIPGSQLSSPDVTIPGSQLSSPDVSIPGSQLNNVIEHPDVCIEKVLSREELVKNYTKEKEAGHLSSQLLTARQKTDEEILRQRKLMKEQEERLRHQVAERERAEALLAVAEKQLVNVKESNTHLKTEIAHVNKEAQLLSKEYMSAIERNKQQTSKYEHLENERKTLQQNIDSLKRELEQTKHLKQLVEDKLESAESANIQFVNGRNRSSSETNVDKLNRLVDDLSQKLCDKETLLNRTTVAFNELLYDYKYLYEETKKATGGRTQNLYAHDCYNRWTQHNVREQCQLKTSKNDVLNKTIQQLKYKVPGTTESFDTERQLSETIHQMQNELEKLKKRNEDLSVDRNAVMCENKKLVVSIKQLQAKIDQNDVYFTDKENLREQLKNKEDQLNVHDAYITSLKENCKDLVKKVQSEHNLRVQQLDQYQSMQDEVARCKAVIARYEKENSEKITAEKCKSTLDMSEFRKEVSGMISDNFNKHTSLVGTQNENVNISGQKSSHEHQLIEELKKRMAIYEQGPQAPKQPTAPAPSQVPSGTPAAPVSYVNNFTVSGVTNSEKKNSYEDIEESPIVKGLEMQLKQLNARLKKQDEELASARSENAKQREAQNNLIVNDLKDNLGKEVQMLTARLSNVESKEQDLNERLSGTQKDLVNARLSHKKEPKMDDTVVNDLKHQVKKLTSKLQSMEHEKQLLNEKLVDAQEEIVEVKTTAAKIPVYSEKRMQHMKKDLENGIHDLAEDLKEANLDGQRVFEEHIEQVNSELTSLEQKVSGVSVNTNNSIKQVIGATDKEIKRCQSNVDNKIGRVFSSRMAKLKTQQKDALVKQRRDFAKLEYEQKKSVSRMEQNMFQYATDISASVTDMKTTVDKEMIDGVQKKLSELADNTEIRFNAVLDVQERIFSALRDRLSSLEGDLANRKTSEVSEKKNEEVTQLKQHICELEQNLKAKTKKESNNNVDDGLKEAIQELKDKTNELEADKAQALRECAEKKDETISTLIGVVREKGATKCEDNKVQFINAWHINRIKEEKAILEAVQPTTTPQGINTNVVLDNPAPIVSNIQPQMVPVPQMAPIPQMAPTPPMAPVPQMDPMPQMVPAQQMAPMQQAPPMSQMAPKQNAAPLPKKTPEQNTTPKQQVSSKRRSKKHQTVSSSSESSSNSDIERKLKIPSITCVSRRSTSGSEDELFVPKTSSEEKVLSSTRRKSRKGKSGSKPEEMRATKDESKTLKESQKQMVKKHHDDEAMKDRKSKKGMPEAEVESFERLVNQCASESPRKRREHLLKKEMNNGKGMPEAEVESCERLVNQCASESPRKRREHLLKKEMNNGKGMPEAEVDSHERLGNQVASESPRKRREHLLKKDVHTGSSIFIFNEDKDNRNIRSIESLSDASVDIQAVPAADDSDEFWGVDRYPKQNKPLKSKKDALSADNVKNAKKEKTPLKVVESDEKVLSTDDKQVAKNAQKVKSGADEIKYLLKPAESDEKMSSADDVKVEESDKTSKNVTADTPAEEIKPKQAPQKLMRVQKPDETVKEESDRVPNVEKPRIRPRRSIKKPSLEPLQEDIDFILNDDIPPPKSSPKGKKKPDPLDDDIAFILSDNISVPPPMKFGHQTKTSVNTSLEDVISDNETPALPPTGKPKARSTLKTTKTDTTPEPALPEPVVPKPPVPEPEVPEPVVPAKKKLPIWLQPTVKPEEKVVEEPLPFTAPPPKRRSDKELPCWLQSMSSKTIPENSVASVKEDVKETVSISTNGRRRSLNGKSETPDWLTSMKKPIPGTESNFLQDEVQKPVQRNIKSRRNMSAEEVLAQAQGSLAIYKNSSSRNTVNTNSSATSQPYRRKCTYGAPLSEADQAKYELEQAKNIARICARSIESEEEEIIAKCLGRKPKNWKTKK